MQIRWTAPTCVRSKGTGYYNAITKASRAHKQERVYAILSLINAAKSMNGKMCRIRQSPELWPQSWARFVDRRHSKQTTPMGDNWPSHLWKRFSAVLHWTLTSHELTALTIVALRNDSSKNRYRTFRKHKPAICQKFGISDHCFSHKSEKAVKTK